MNKIDEIALRVTAKNLNYGMVCEAIKEKP